MSPRSPRCDKLLIRFFCREEIEGFRSWSSKITSNFRLSSPPPSPFRKKKNKDTLIRDSSDNFGYNCQAEIKLRASMLRFDSFSNSSPPLLKRDLFLERCRTKKKKKKKDRVSIRNYHRVIRTRDKSRLFNLNANERRLKGGTYLRIAFQELAFLRTRSKGGRKRRKGREREENRKGKR